MALSIIFCDILLFLKIKNPSLHFELFTIVKVKNILLQIYILFASPLSLHL